MGSPRFEELGPQSCDKDRGQRPFKPVHWGGLLLKEVLSSVSLTSRSALTHAHPHVHTPACWLTWAWGIANLGCLQRSGYYNHKMSLERKTPATPTIQDHLSLSVLTGWQWRSQNQEHEAATAAPVSLSRRHLVPVQRAKPVAGIFVREFSSTLPPPLKTSTEHPSFPSWSEKDKKFPDPKSQFFPTKTS